LTYINPDIKTNTAGVTQNAEYQTFIKIQFFQQFL